MFYFCFLLAGALQWFGIESCVLRSGDSPAVLRLRLLQGLA